MRSKPIPSGRHPHLLAAALLWLFGGSVLLATTLVPAYTELFGWAPFLWLFLAPMAVALTLEPKLLRHVLALRRPRRRNASQLIWN